MKKIQSIIILAVIVLLAGHYSLSLAANPPEPTYGSAVVDGDISEWDLTNDYFAAMGEGFDPINKHASDLYLRYDCSTQTLYQLVVTVDGYTLDADGDIWIAIGTSNNKIRPFAQAFSPDFTGFEASYHLAPGAYTFLAHVNVNGGATSGTPKDTFIDLTIGCPASIDIEKYTNGVDADQPTGPAIPVGGQVTWTYMVTNTGGSELFGVSVVDDNGTPEDSTDDFSPTCSWPGDEGYLAVGGSVECTAAGSVSEGQYSNIAKVIGNTCIEQECDELTDEDPSHYIGTMDYGDLPMAFGITTLAQDGARHSLGDVNLSIGLDKDLEGDGIPDSAALGDDLNNVADEEGVYRPTGSNWSDGQGELAVLVDVDVPAEGFVGCLTGWLDFHDGAGGGPNSSFDDAGEYVFQNVAVVIGENQLTFPLPLGVADDASFFGRFRLVPLTGGVVEGNCTQTALEYTGSAEGGEVEDQVFVFGPTAVSLAGFSARSPISTIQVIVLLAAIGILSLMALVSFTVRKYKSLA